MAPPANRYYRILFNDYETRIGGPGRSPEAEERLGRLTEFGAWSEYFTSLPAVLIVRATPKMVEGFWKRLGREAARTQVTLSLYSEAQPERADTLMPTRAIIDQLWNDFAPYRATSSATGR